MPGPSYWEIIQVIRLRVPSSLLTTMQQNRSSPMMMGFIPTTRLCFSYKVGTQATVFSEPYLLQVLQWHFNYLSLHGCWTCQFNWKALKPVSPPLWTSGHCSYANLKSHQSDTASALLQKKIIHQKLWLVDRQPLSGISSLANSKCLSPTMMLSSPNIVSSWNHCTALECVPLHYPTTTGFPLMLRCYLSQLCHRTHLFKKHKPCKSSLPPISTQSKKTCWAKQGWNP